MRQRCDVGVVEGDPGLAIVEASAHAQDLKGSIPGAQAEVARSLPRWRIVLPVNEAVEGSPSGVVVMIARDCVYAWLPERGVFFEDLLQHHREVVLELIGSP